MHICFSEGTTKYCHPKRGINGPLEQAGYKESIMKERKRLSSTQAMRTINYKSSNNLQQLKTAKKG